MSDLILYATNDGRTHINLRAKDQTVLLYQLDLRQFYTGSKENVEPLFKNIFSAGRLAEKPFTEVSLATAADTNHSQTAEWSFS